MSDVNEYTEKALKRYVQMENPQFAVLINGEWGTGKTWFVKNFFATHDFQKKFCYISLFGVESLKEIDAALIDQIAHFTESQCIRIASKITRFAIEKYTGYDIQEIEDLGTRISEKIPEGVIICLDDIERSHLEIKTVFGYVSNLLEQFESNVILICNSNKIEDNSFFDKNLEKIVGIHLNVDNDIHSFINSSIDCIHDSVLNSFLISNKSIIIDYFYHYEIHSMRYIRILIYHFEALYSEVAHKENENYIKSLLVSLCDAFFRRLLLGSPQDDEQTITSRLKNDYFKSDIIKKYNILCPILNTGLKSFWDGFFISGIIDLDILEFDYNNSLYNEKNKNTPMQLWDYYFRDDDFVLSTYEKMRSELENCEYTSINMLLHAVGIVLEMVDINVEQRHIDFSYFKKIIDNTNFDTTQTSFDKASFSNYSRLGYRQSKSEIFIKVKDYIFEKQMQLSKNKRSDMFNFIVKNSTNPNCAVFQKNLLENSYNVNLEKIDSQSIINSISIYKNSTLIDIMSITEAIIQNNTDSPFFSTWASDLLLKIEKKAIEIKSTQKIKFITLQRTINLLKKYIQ